MRGQPETRDTDMSGATRTPGGRNRGIQMQFCMRCGSGNVAHRVPEMDNRPRDVCGACGHVHYENPRIVAGCLAWWEERLLLCQRAIEPRDGLWTLPAGFMESGETAAEAAARETLEEANSRVEVDSLYALLSLPHANQVYLVYRARMLTPECSPGLESRRTELLHPDQIPWEHLAFATMRYTLRLYVEDLQKGDFTTHVGDVLKDGNDYRLRLHQAPP